MVTAPAPLSEAMLNEYALGQPMCGVASLLNRMRSIALASVAVPTVDRGSAPSRCWSTMIAVVMPVEHVDLGAGEGGHEALDEGAVGLVDQPL